MATIDSRDPFVAEMALKLAHLRALQGLTLEQVSRQCGVTLQQIHNYENGRSAIPAAMIVRLADCLAAPAEDFFPTSSDEAARLPGRDFTSLDGCAWPTTSWDPARIAPPIASAPRREQASPPWPLPDLHPGKRRTTRSDP